MEYLGPTPSLAQTEDKALCQINEAHSKRGPKTNPHLHAITLVWVVSPAMNTLVLKSGNRTMGDRELYSKTP